MLSLCMIKITYTCVLIDIIKLAIYYYDLYYYEILSKLQHTCIKINLKNTNTKY